MLEGLQMNLPRRGDILCTDDGQTIVVLSVRLDATGNLEKICFRSGQNLMEADAEWWRQTSPLLTHVGRKKLAVDPILDMFGSLNTMKEEGNVFAAARSDYDNEPVTVLVGRGTEMCDILDKIAKRLADEINKEKPPAGPTFN